MSWRHALIALTTLVATTLETDAGLPAFSNVAAPARSARAVAERGLVDQAATPDLAAVARAVVAAFNARDIDTMLSMATDEVEWIGVSGLKLVIETSGKDALRRSMTAYFKSCPTCQSQIDVSAVTTSRLAAVETASWKVNDSPRSQRSLSVYEFENGRIRRVYYYPVEK